MSDQPKTPDFVMNPGEKTTLLFTQMVFQLSSLATMLLGKMPHPETGETKRDLEAAQLIIDQLEMLEVKTKGNLSPDEQQLLKQNLMSLRMAYVEAVNEPKAGDTPDDTPDPKAGEAPSGQAADSASQSTDPDPESKKRFTKKY
jgi:hypothetical protein